MNEWVLKTGTLVALMASSFAYAQESADLEAKIRAVGPEHPRLFFSEAETGDLKAKIAADPLLQGVLEHIVAASDETTEMEPVKREKVGKRLLGVSRLCLQRVSYLAMAYRLTGEETHLKRAEQEMVAAASFEDWNPSHFLDVAEMTAALAIGYDWLYTDLDPDARTAIRDAIVDKGLKTSLEGGWWVTTENNWNQVCHGGLTLGALAVLEDDPELAHTIIARAIKHVPKAMHEYEPDGVYPEGPSYWKYGTTYNVILISALESVLGTDFGLSEARGFMQSPDFYLQATGPTGMFFNFSDCGLRGGVATAMHWFAARRDDPTLLFHERQELRAFAGDDRPGSDRTLPFLLIWSMPQGDAGTPNQLHWQGDGRTPIAILRTGWDENATYLGIKAGSPSANHAHMDVGSFVLDRDGVRWAIDLGSQSYNSLESRGIGLWGKSQDSERWTVFRLNNFSHNTLVVDGQSQQVSGHAAITQFSDAAQNPFAMVDLTPVYDGQVAEARRGFRLIGEDVLIQDEITALNHAASVRWGMATQAEVVTTGDNTAVLKQDGKTLALRVLAPSSAEIAVLDMEKPPHDYDAENPNTRMVSFTVAVPASATETVAVLITSDGDVAQAANITPLADWR